MSDRPLLPLALAFACGAALPTLGAPPIGLGAALAAAPLALSPLLAPGALFAAGWAVASAARGRPVPEPDAEVVTLEGRVVSVPERLDEGRTRFTLREAGGRLLLVSTSDLPWPLALWDRVSLQARLRTPAGPRNPGGRDRRAEGLARGVAVEALAASAPVRIAPPSLLARLELARLRFGERASSLLPQREAALVRAVGAGDRSALDPATTEAFARSGLAHLLAVSGLHLSVVAFGAYRLARAALARWEAFALRVEPRRAAAALALPAAGLFALATGAGVPVIRSALAAALAFLGVTIDRRPDASSALAAAGGCLLAFDPGALSDVSFQLSFASVGSLALLAAPLRGALPFARGERGLARVRELLLRALCASAVATVATAPIVAFHFRRISLVGVLSNLPGIPLGMALTVVSAASTLLHAVAPPLATPLLLACRPLAWGLLGVARLMASPSWAAPAVGSPGLVLTVSSMAALVIACRLRGRWRTIAALAALLALLAAPPLRRALALRRGGLEVLFLGVGQGDATAFLLPDGSAVLVDGGGEARGRYDPGARDVVPFLRDAGVRRIAAAFVSHPHPDHLLGLVAVAAAFPVDHLFSNGRRGGADVAPAWVALPEPVRLGPGQVLERAGVRFEVLGPPPGSDAWSENDASLVLRVTHGAVSFLMPGDIEAEGEAALVEKLPPEALRAAVVKAPHHGSRTSSTPAFAAATGARFAVMTVGHANRFGFPAEEVVARWARAGTEVLRTGEGAVRFLSDGRLVRLTRADAALDLLTLWREGEPRAGGAE